MVVHCELSMNGLKGEIQGATLGVTENSQIIDEWPHRWPDGIVTYRLNNLSPDIEKAEWQVRAVTVAWRVWQLRVKDVKFRRVRDPDVEVDVNISFEKLSAFNGRKGVLADAVLPGQGKASGTVRINDEWNWVPGVKWSTLAKPPLVPILIHEFGHVLGLRHDTSSMDEMMYPSFDLGKKKNKLGKNDVKRIQGEADFIGYGKRSLPQRIIDYFIKRRTEGYDYR